MEQASLPARSTAHDVRHLIHLALLALERPDDPDLDAARKALAGATEVLEPPEARSKATLPRPVAKDVLYVVDLWCGTGTGGPFALEVRDSPVVAVDPWIVRRAVLNLLLNARAASHDVIGIEVGAERGEAVIRVRDSGRGMTKEDLERLREQTPLDRENGHGIGLFGTIAAVQAVGGRLDLESDDTSGTTATLRFPALLGATSRPTTEAQRWSA